MAASRLGNSRFNGLKLSGLTHGISGSSVTLASAGVGILQRRYATVQHPVVGDPSITAKPAATLFPQLDLNRNVTIPYIPELFDEKFLDKLLPNKPSVVATPNGVQHPFTDMLNETSMRTRTQNQDPAYNTTGSAVLDAFSTLDGNTGRLQVEKMLRESWQEDPLKTVKIIFNLRSIHEGKSAKIGFYYGFGWLYKYHPKTAIANLHALVDRLIEPPRKEGVETQQLGLTHGYYKDLLNLLLLAVKDELNTSTPNFLALNTFTPPTDWDIKKKRREKWEASDQANTRAFGPEVARAMKAARLKETELKTQEKARQQRVKQREEAFSQLQRKLRKDKAFRALYIAVARIFADAIHHDATLLKTLQDPSLSTGERKNLSLRLTLAPKWAPSLNLAHDRYTNISTAVAILLRARGAMPFLEYVNVTNGSVRLEDARRLRSIYRRWFISPLRRYANITEVLMSANKWNEIDYGRVPSLCFKNNKDHFFKHDEDRLVSFLLDVADGKRKISGATLLPHELVQEAEQINHKMEYLKGTLERRLAEVNGDILDAQWRALVDRLRGSGKLENCIAVCDVSGSMWNIYNCHGRDFQVMPYYPAMAMTLLLTQLARPPWNKKFLTFSSTPDILSLPDSPDTKLHQLVKGLDHSEWRANTNFEATFNLLLHHAQHHKLKRHEMVKRVFVFSDMQFDEAESGEETEKWDTSHKRVVKAFDDAGYDMPEMVYWNLAGDAAAKPVTKDTPGVALVSGFSGNMLKVFMEEEDLSGAEAGIVEATSAPVGRSAAVKRNPTSTPEDFMNKALDKTCYDSLVVVD